jgi:predicted ATPase
MVQASGVISKERVRSSSGGTAEDVTARVPQGLHPLIERYIERVPLIDRQILAVASIVGVEFSTEAIAAVLEADVAQVERRCTELSRRQFFIQPASPVVQSEQRNEQGQDPSRTLQYYRHAAENATQRYASIE